MNDLFSVLDPLLSVIDCGDEATQLSATAYDAEV